MVSDFNTQESYQFFLEEAAELLQILEQGLVNLSADYSLEDVYNLMRTAHSIKGGATLVGLTQIERLAHKLESIFKLFYESQATIDAEIEKLLLQAYHCLRSPLLEHIKTGHSSGDKELAKITNLLTKIQQKLGQTDLQKNDNLDVIRNNNSLFNREIKGGLNRLEIILNNPHAPQTADTLKAQINILQGLAEIAQNDNLLSITKETIKNLESNPDLLIKIGKTALEKMRYVLNLTNFKNHANNLDAELSDPQKDIYQLEKKDAHHLVDKTVFASQLKIAEESNNLDNNQDLSPNLINATLLPIRKRVDLIALNKLSNLFSELVILENNVFADQISQQKVIKSLIKWLSQLTQIILNQDSLFNKNTLVNHNQNKSFQSQINIQEYLSQLKEIIQDIELLNKRGFQEHEKKHKIFKQINNHLLHARMLPIGSLLKQFPLLIKELALQNNKQIELLIIGEDLLIDKLIIEKLYNPLIHLLKNAVSHGIESADIREKKGKNKQGKITINTYKTPNKIIIEINDDGGGIKIDKIKRIIKDKNFLTDQELTEKSQQELYQYLFKNDFSTAENLNNLAGRGMGLSIVKSEISALKGEIKVNSQENLGTSFILEIPLSLSFIKLLIFKLNGHKIAIPFDNLVSILSVTEKDLEISGQRQFYQWQGKSIPLYPQSIFLTYNYPNQKYDFESSNNTVKTLKENNQERFPLLLIGNHNKMIAFKVDAVITLQELLIKPFNNLIKHPAYLSSCTISTEGKLIPVLDGQSLINQWLELPNNDLGSTLTSFMFSTNYAQIIKSLGNSPYSFSIKPIKIPTILVIDDSLTIRQSLSLTLQKNGCTVIQAQDGWEALTYLKQNLDIRVVICDIEMPKMNGLEFLSHCRQSKYKSLPVIMLTSRSSEKYRDLALKLGADNYLTKPYLDKDLLYIINSYL